MHLNADELVDLAEGARPESSAPHLATCGPCRAKLADLRAMMSAVADVEVPEPSPLFWDHFSQRVHNAVAAEPEPRRSWFDAAAWRRALLPLSAIAVASLAIVVVFNSRLMAPHAPVVPSGAVGVVAQPAPLAARDLLSDFPVEGDASLSLVASLAASLDADTAGETGLAAVGSAEHAVTHMNDGELRELHRILQEEMAP